ncbi:DUF2834 domain-containing protein [Phaeovulum sp. NW3]|uniref:DUF2834 domain-containing protein n=1 Tax=Phaeovulum sp. NW3 TaxID=2934933 RepID=UPI002021AB2C|nr:DUF2834 domain-containing protein [Phaeovulum sp. NW3]MCL7463799.1 DUF2834 domain-containing protein [Phaeovulum sp. NW3]
MPLSPLRLSYLGLALIGAVLPMRYFLEYLAANGWSLIALRDAWFVNAATEGLTWDLTIAAAALTVWIVAEVRVRRNWVALVAIPATFCIGVSCGLPLYLYLRTRKVG